MTTTSSKARVTFIQQEAPVDEYGRALYAVCRSVLRAVLDSLSDDDLSDLNTPVSRVTMRQLAKVARLDRDKGMLGDGFEWAVHEAILGQEPLVVNLIADALKHSSRFVSGAAPTSVLFGFERAAPSGSGLALTHCRGDGGSVCCRPAEMFGHPPIADDDHRVTPAVREVV